MAWLAPSCLELKNVDVFWPLPSLGLLHIVIKGLVRDRETNRPAIFKFMQQFHSYAENKYSGQSGACLKQQTTAPFVPHLHDGSRRRPRLIRSKKGPKTGAD